MQVGLRMPKEDKEKLDEMCDKTSRSQSDMIRFLVRQEYERLFAKKVEHRTTDGMITYDELERLR